MIHMTVDSSELSRVVLPRFETGLQGPGDMWKPTLEPCNGKCFSSLTNERGKYYKRGMNDGRKTLTKRSFRKEQKYNETSQYSDRQIYGNWTKCRYFV